VFVLYVAVAVVHVFRKYLLTTSPENLERFFSACYDSSLDKILKIAYEIYQRYPLRPLGFHPLRKGYAKRSPRMTTEVGPPLFSVKNESLSKRHFHGESASPCAFENFSTQPPKGVKINEDSCSTDLEAAPTPTPSSLEDSLSLENCQEALLIRMLHRRFQHSIEDAVYVQKDLDWNIRKLFAKLYKREKETLLLFDDLKLLRKQKYKFSQKTSPSLIDKHQHSDTKKQKTISGLNKDKVLFQLLELCDEQQLQEILRLNNFQKRNHTFFSGSIHNSCEESNNNITAKSIETIYSKGNSSNSQLCEESTNSNNDNSMETRFLKGNSGDSQLLVQDNLISTRAEESKTSYSHDDLSIFEQTEKLKADAQELLVRYENVLKNMVTAISTQKKKEGFQCSAYSNISHN
jgi:hypothetical protein